jgi:hypothetical chaperone protein
MDEGWIMIGVGLDFGTSNSTIAWFDGTNLHFVQVEARSSVLPTAIHLSREYVGATGSQAIDRYIEENSARLVQLVPEIIGQAAGTIGDASTDSEMTELDTSRDVVFGPLIDHGLPGRLFLGLKRLLGNSSVERLLVFARPYRLVALLTPVLLRLRESVELELKAKVTCVHVGRPVDFEGRENSRNRLAIGRLTEACEHAGFSDMKFYPEPIAATVSFLWQQQLLRAGRVLTVDFGGGTLDMSVVEYADRNFRVLATAGADLGGDRIDQVIFRRLLFPLLGEGEVWSRQVDGRRIETLFPFGEYEEGLLNWAITHTLNQNRYKTKLSEMIASGGPAAEKFQRLKDLINYNYSYSVFTAIKKAKAELSVLEETSIDIPELNLSVAFSRVHFALMLREAMARINTLIDAVLSRAHLQPKDVDLVVRTGGSSQIVAVRDLLETLFPGKVTEHDPFTSVAGGLAIANYFGYRFAENDYRNRTGMASAKGNSEK